MLLEMERIDEAGIVTKSLLDAILQTVGLNPNRDNIVADEYLMHEFDLRSTVRDEWPHTILQ